MIRTWGPQPGETGAVNVAKMAGQLPGINQFGDIKGEIYPENYDLPDI